MLARAARASRNEEVWAEIAITDHDSVQGALQAVAANRDAGFLVIVGEEVLTDAGDIIGLFLTQAVRARHWKDVIGEIHEQQGIAVLPHPYHGHPAIEELAEAVDAIEVFNARESPAKNRQAFLLAERLGKPKVAGSDAHSAREIGTAAVEVEDGGNAKDLLLRGTSQWREKYTARWQITLTEIVSALRQKNYARLPLLMAVFVKRLLVD